MNYVTGNTIKRLREKKGITQKQLADMLAVSDKTVSKWETGKGLPDIGIIKELAEALQVSIAELLTGDVVKNENTSGEKCSPRSRRKRIRLFTLLKIQCLPFQD